MQDAKPKWAMNAYEAEGGPRYEMQAQSAPVELPGQEAFQELPTELDSPR